MTTTDSETNPVTDDLVSAHVFVSGRVQGVGYRASTTDAAALLKINGWVRNLRDGRVEALFEGSADQVEEMIRWCYKGPPSAVVRDVHVDYVEPSQAKGFHIAR